MASAGRDAQVVEKVKPLDTGRRAEIIARATELYSEADMLGISMADIAKRTGIAKPTLYHYFESKEDLIYEILEQLFVKALRPHDNPQVSTLGDIRLIMRNLVHLVHDHKGAVKLFFEFHQDLSHKSSMQVVEKRRIYERYVQDIFQDLIDEGVMRPVDVKIASRAMYGMCLWTYTWYDPDGPMNPDEIADFFYDVLAVGLTPRD